MREIKIDLSTAQRWYKSQDEELKTLALQTYPELKKMYTSNIDSWESLGEISGWCVDDDSKIIQVDYVMSSSKYHRNVFKTREQAEASIAMAMLSQLMAKEHGDWKAEWKNEHQKKQCIVFVKNIPKMVVFVSIKQFLHFKDLPTAEKFLEKHRELILKAEPLL